mmetsp:Transcript_12514/g.25474  ORF Transcript_12514/g.25474 Transcript_12514/m.25474 type:complete len:1217 (-) Transcript_12514:149-3799(-)
MDEPGTHGRTHRRRKTEELELPGAPGGQIERQSMVVIDSGVEVTGAGDAGKDLEDAKHQDDTKAPTPHQLDSLNIRSFRVSPNTHFGFEYCIAVKDFMTAKEKQRRQGGTELKEMHKEEPQEEKKDRRPWPVFSWNPLHCCAPPKKSVEKLERERAECERLIQFLLADIRGTFPEAVVVRSTEQDSSLQILIGVTREDLTHVADRTKLVMMLNPARAHAKAYELDLPLAAHFESLEEVWNHIYAPFDRDHKNLFEDYEEAYPGVFPGKRKAKFREVDRLNIIDYVVNDDDLINGLNLDEKYEPIFEASFPLHNERTRGDLLREWRGYMCPCACGAGSRSEEESTFLEKDNQHAKGAGTREVDLEAKGEQEEIGEGATETGDSDKGEVSLSKGGDDVASETGKAEDHEEQQPGVLSRAWPFAQPIDKIEAYLGQKLALYFEFLRIHTLFLIPLSVLGLAVFLYQVVGGGIDNLLTAAYSIYVVLHFMTFRRCHEQNESTLATRWGSTKVHEQERVRPEYKGEVNWSVIDGSLQIENNLAMRCYRVTVATIAVLLILGFIYGALFAGFILETYIEGTLYAGLIFAVVLSVVNALTRILAEKLTYFENPKTVSGFKNSMIWKLVLFKFLTGFGLLYYSAFIQEYHTGDCGETSCEARTAQLLRGTFIGMILINNFLELALPLMTSFANKCLNYVMGYSSDEDHENPIEAQLNSEPYEGTVDDYDELVNQIGFTTFFVPFFPIAPVLALLNNYIEVQVDSTKILTVHRRPVPERAASSGAWNHILNVFTWIMLLTNAAAIMFRFDAVSNLFNLEKTSEKFLGFLIIIVGVLIVKFLIINYVIPRKTKKVAEHFERQENLWPYLLGLKTKWDGLEFSYEYDLAEVQRKIEYDAKKDKWNEKRKAEAILKKKDPLHNLEKKDPRASFVQDEGEDADDAKENIDLQFQELPAPEPEKEPITIASILAEGKHLPSFFTGGRSPIMFIKVFFQNGFIQDFHIENEPPAEIPQMCGGGWCCGDEEHLEPEDTQRMVRMATMAILDSKTGLIAKDGCVKFPIQQEKGEDKFVTNIFMRFDTSERHDHARLVGIRFEVDEAPEPQDKWDWIGQKEGGQVVHLLESVPSSGPVGRKGAVVALKGVRERQDPTSPIIALEWLCNVFPKLAQRHRTSADAIKVIEEDSALYDEEVVPLVYGDPSKFKAPENTTKPKSAQPQKDSEDKKEAA